jgi:MFS family permease
MLPRSPKLIAFLTVAVDLLGFGIVLPLLPLYGDHFLGDIPRAYHGLVIGLLLSSFSLMQFLFAPAWGRLSDRIGRRPVLLVGLSGSVVFYLLFGYATLVQSLALLFLARIGAGISGATLGTAQAVIADSTPPQTRAKGMALIGMAFGVGFTFGPMIGAFFAGEAAGSSLSAAPGFVAAGLSLAALLLAFALLPETRPEGAEPRRRPWFDLEGWKLALGNRHVALPLLTFFFATLAFASFEGTLARFVRYELRFSFRQMGLLFAYIGVVLMLVQGLIVRKLVTRWGEPRMCVAGIALMLAGLIVMGWAVASRLLFSVPIVTLAGQPESALSHSSLLVVLGTLAAAVSGFAFLTPSAQALISRRTSALRQGEVLGVNQAAAAIARILGPLLGNLLYGSQESPRTTWPFYGAGVLLGVAFLLAVLLWSDSAASPLDAPKHSSS